MKSSLLLITPIGIFAAMIGVFAVTLNRDTEPLPSRYIDRPVPDFDLVNLYAGDNRVSRARLEGDIALINVFGSWCIACQIEHPLLMQIAREGVIPIVGINWRDSREAALAWLARHGDPYRIIGVDPDSEFIINLGVTGAPETFILDHRGRLRYRYQGPLTALIWESEMEPFIAELQIAADRGR